MSLTSLDILAPISLSELTQSSALMSRVDRKYFVPRTVVAELIAENQDQARVLEINGLRTFTYETVYFDTPEFGFYRAHAQGKRSRYKVRVRTYTQSGLRMLEVKSKGFRGRTLKERIDFPTQQPPRPGAGMGPNFEDLQFGAPEQRFIEKIIKSDSRVLTPVLTTVYRRSTLALGDQRVTLDTNLECMAGDQVFHGPDDVLVETKSPARASAFDAALKSRGIRPATVSKYQVGASLLYPYLPHNKWNRTLRQYFLTEPSPLQVSVPTYH